MKPLYRAEVTYDGVAIVGGTLDNFPADAVYQSLFFVARDDSPTVGTNHYGISAKVAYNAFGGGPTYEWRAEFSPLYGLPQPGTSEEALILDGFGFPIRFVEADGNNGSAHFSGATLAIQKDCQAETISWITPLGTYTLAWNDPLFPIALDAAPLLANGMGHQYDRPGIGLNTDPVTSEQAVWHGFYAKQDGIIFQGADLTSADPGIFTAWIDDPVYRSGAACVRDDTQLAGGYQSGYHFATGDGSRARHQREIRFWDGVATNHGIDMGRAPEHCLLWHLSIQDYQPYRVWFRRSYDNGRSWEAPTIYEEPGQSFTWPSITYWNGRLNAMWSDGGNTYQASSVTAGITWNDPVILPYTGTNPRHITEWTSGLYLYFFFNGGDLKVARSTDYGHTFIDAAPLTVAAGVTAQQIDAEFAFDGSAVVSYFVAGAWTQLRSFDMGMSWS